MNQKPKTGGVARVPVVMQLEALECGAAALAMVAAWYGKWIPLEQVRADCGVSRDGSKAKNICRAAEGYGLRVEAFRMEPEVLRTDGHFPCILHWNMNHFVVLCGFRGKWAYLNDPARGRVKVSEEEFDKSFTGIVLEFAPSDRFVADGHRPSMAAFARKRLVGTAAATGFIVLSTLIACLFGVINSYTARLFVDRYLIAHNPVWLRIFLLILTGLAVVELAAQWVYAIHSLKIKSKMAVVGSASFLWRVLHLPMSFFAQRMAGDIQSRLPLNASIVETLVKALAPMLLNSGIIVIYIVVIVWRSPILAMIGLLSLLLNVTVATLTSHRRMDIARIQMRDRAKMEATAVTGIDMIETIKSSGAEHAFFQSWANFQASDTETSVRAARTDVLLGSLPVFLNEVINYAVLVLGVLLTMQGRFTLGTILLFQSLLSAFLKPAMQVISASLTITEMRTQMERVNDVMEYPTDPNTAEEDAQPLEDAHKLRRVELKNVSFGYSALEKPLIENLSLSVEPGKRIALVGASGCGKSTVSNLISGLYQPWSGEILFDGKPRQAWPREVVVGSLAVVDQDIILFEDTIENNIKMWDSSIQDFEVILAARDAQLHNEIVGLPGGYQYRLISGGRNLSGGQRQQLEIARVLAQDPTIIILDEATSALDARTEYETVKAVTARGIACIVIGHRLSTIRDCDEILVLDHGKVIERGTHDGLMALGGAYAQLVFSS